MGIDAINAPKALPEVSRLASIGECPCAYDVRFSGVPAQVLLVVG